MGGLSHGIIILSYCDSGPLKLACYSETVFLYG
jgi:hypothetical protein